MRTVTYKLEDMKTKVIHIGKVAENDATRVQIDAGSVFADYPAAVPAMSMISPDGTAFPVSVERSGNFVVWDVKDSALAAEGPGEIQVTFTAGETVVKGPVGRVQVCRSIVADGEAPDPIQDWLTEAGEALEEIEGISATAETLSAGSSATASYSDGVLSFGIPQGAQGEPGQSGADGKDGADGEDGVSPTVAVTEITGGHTVTITDAQGDHAFNVMDGTAGAVIDDTSTAADKVWSASKTNELKSAIQQKITEPETEGTSGQVLTTDGNGGRSWTTVQGGGGANIDDTAGAGDTDKAWSANKLTTEFGTKETEIEGAYSHGYAPAVQGWSDAAVSYEDGYIDNNGSVASNSNFRHSNYITCVEGDQIYYKLYGYSSTVYIVTFYNASKQKISNIVGITGEKEGTAIAPANTAYVVFSSQNGNPGTFTVSNIQRVATDTTVANLKAYTDEKTSVTQTSVKLTRANLKIIEGSICSNEGTNHIYNLAAGRRTDYIPVSQGDTVKYRCYAYIGESVKTYTIGAFDTNKSLVAHVKGETTGVINGTYTVPSGVAYVMVSWAWDYSALNNGWFEITLASYPQSLVDFINDKYIAEISPLNGKQWCCLGDSITAGANTSRTYLNYIEERTAITPWCYGVSNTAIAKSSAAVTNNMATRYSSMMEDVDYVTVFGGTNDHGQEIPIGEWGDSDQLTLYGAMKILCEGLIAKYIGKKIGFILPLPKYQEPGGVGTDYSYPSESFYPYIQCIEDVCKRYSIPVLNLYLESNLAVGNSSVRSGLIPDGLHPNSSGHLFISRKIQTFLESL